jgi:beta-lactamase class A
MYNSYVMIDRYRNYQPYRPAAPRRKKRRSGLSTLVVVALLVFGGKTVWGKIQSSQSPKPAANSTPKPAKKVLAEPIPSTTWSDLNQKVNVLINQNPGLDISVAVIDISSSTKANYGIQDNFAGASTTKVLTAAAYLNAVENGSRSLTKTISGKSAKEHLRLMINKSDNNSWAALNSDLTYTKIKAFAHSLGISSYNPTKNLITASDEALLLQKLYSGNLLSDTNKKLLLSYMQNTNNEDMIPKVSPSGAKLYHKYGQLEDRLHDAAILDYKDRPLVIVIYTKGGASDGSNYTTRTKLVKDLAQTIIDTIYAI